MCGIVGYIGKNKALPFLIEGLKKLEYRGYDSSGICVKENNDFYLVKKKGKISELEGHLDFKNVSGSLGIAHTRWATHGEPSEKNAHPHLDCRGRFAIVHNGIIENYSSLKKLLQKEGHKITSDTDSEVVAHLIEKFYPVRNSSPHRPFGRVSAGGVSNGVYQDDLEKAVRKTLTLIEGAYALAILDKSSENIIIVRKSSPLVLGIGKKEIFIASDVSAVLSKTKKVIYLDDNEIAVLTKGGYVIKNLNGKLIDKKVHKIKWTILEIEKGGFRHFMLKEIFEQPDAIENTLRGRILKNKVKLNINLDLKKINRIIITACGTSWCSALIGKHLIEKFTKVSVEVDYASEFRYRDPIVRQDDLVIVISQSGETADTLAALKEAKKKGAKTLGIVNAVGSTISREVDTGIYLHAGPEIGVATTKAFSCQIIALILFSLYFAQVRGQSFDKNILKEIKVIPKLIKEFLKQSKNIRLIAKKYKNYKNFLYLGRNLNFPVALEGALKLKEISYIHAEGYPAAEMKHGPIALVDENMPVVFICPQDETYQKILSNMEEIKARKGNIIAIINKSDDKVLKLAKYIIKVPKTIDILSPLLNVLPLQLLAYHIADLKGLNVDKPRNLAKSVTVE